MDLRIGTKAEGTDQYSDRNLSGTVHTHIENVIGIRLILQPCATVRDYCTGIQLFYLILSCADSIVDTRGTNQLADNYTFSAVDHESTCVSHQWEDHP